MRTRRTLLIYLCTGTSFGAIAVRSFLVPLRAHELGIDRFQVGILAAIGLLVGGLLSLPAGFLCDRFGRRRILMAALASGAASQLWFVQASTLPQMYGAQLLLGLMTGGMQTALFAALADAVPARRLGSALGWLTLSMQLGFLSGPAVAGAALQVLSIRSDLLAGTAVFAAALLLGWFATAEERPHGAVAWNISGPLREVLGTRGFYALVPGLLGAATMWGSLQAFLPLFAKETLRLPGPQIGYLLALQAVVNGLARIPSGRLVDTGRRRELLVFGGTAAMAVSVAVLPHLRGFWAPALDLMAGVPFNALAFVALGVGFGSLTSAGSRGFAMGLYSAGLFLGLGLGPALYGGVMQAAGYDTGYLVTAAVAVLLTAVMAAVATLGGVPGHRLEAGDPLLERRVSGEEARK